MTTESTQLAASPAYKFGRILAIFHSSVPGGFPPSLINNALALPASHYGTLAQIAGPHLDDAAREAVNAVIGDGLDLPRTLIPVRQLDVWLGYYHEINRMDGGRRITDRDVAEVEDSHDLLA